MRGMMCGVCDFSSTFYFTGRVFYIDESECWRYTENCGFHLKATIVFLEYVKFFAQLGSCKEKGIVIDDAEKPYIYQSSQTIINLCLQNDKSNYCKETCEKYMPWTGITLMEQRKFDDIFKLLFKIKHFFPDEVYTRASDETIDTWETSKDHG